MAVVAGLITLADAKASLGIPLATTTNDADLERYIEAATPVIENITGPIIPVSRVFAVDGGSYAVLVGCRFNAVTSVAESGTVITDFVSDGEAGIIYAGSTAGSRAFTSGVRNVIVTVTVGSAAVPPNVALATRELVRHWWQLGRQGNRPAFGNEGVGEVSVPSGFAVPRRVIELCEPNRRMAGFA
ncbi:phage gp6-like head-tail connector protein [Cryobacterium sp. Sr8]|uniref:phage gp6-like head-tail connector protein n=1 Tax=Cryobacterium sp. Sr8 TaxID=1259203 RepID=UPI00106D4BBF|nr:phage gp6-like head-tail connector protein [Cryobacterium sp. Sr8]TFD80710.1 phage gp6-like head-tail connector protein [Cryobacterium sp. Sr8]